MPPPLNPRRLAFGAAKRLLLASSEGEGDFADKLTRLTDLIPSPEKSAMSRSRDRILANLDEMYGEAFEAAKSSMDEKQQRSLDFAYRREQLYFEILLDIRDAMLARR